MPCSLFGKLTAKRDFIAVLAPRDVLAIWEPWMQAGVSASRHGLGREWQRAYLAAPIWRFWLGAEICGATVLGAFMPSVDGLGRYYPLTVFACAQPGTALPPPDLAAHDSWCAAAEEFLLATLDKDLAYDAILDALGRMAMPEHATLAEPPPGMAALTGGAVVAPLGSDIGSGVFAALRAANHAATYAAASFWWTLGGDGFPPIALGSRRMPDPSLFAGMLTGRFSPASRPA